MSFGVDGTDAKAMNATKIQTTVLMGAKERLTPTDKKNLREIIELAARHFMEERGIVGPNCVLSILDEEPEMDLRAKIVRNYAARA
jgi:hypothetical protein